MDKISEYILKKAREVGVCEPGAVEISETSSKDDLLRLYVKRIDYCLDKDLPTKEDLVRLGGELLPSHGIWVDDELSAQDASFLVLLGACKGDVSISGYTVSQIFIKHTGQAHIVVSDNAFVVIDCFDDAAITVTASGNSKTLINIYGRAQVTHSTTDNAKVKIIHKNKANY